jgi:hypothetical protein
MLKFNSGRKYKALALSRKAQGAGHKAKESASSTLNPDGFVESQIGSPRCPLSGVSTPAAKFQELVASFSNSLEFLTPPVSKPFSRKGQCRFPIRLFTGLSSLNRF